MFVSGHLNSLPAQGGEESPQQHKPPTPSTKSLVSGGRFISLHSDNSSHYTICPTQVSAAVFKYMEMELIHHQTYTFLTPIKNKPSPAVSTYIQTLCSINMLENSEPSGMVYICILHLRWGYQAPRPRGQRWTKEETSEREDHIHWPNSSLNWLVKFSCYKGRSTIFRRGFRLRFAHCSNNWCVKCTL